MYTEARNEARKEFISLKYNPVFIAGLMLYWGEGDKVDKSHVRLTNIDSEMVKLFKVFLIDVCNIPLSKIRAQVLVYPDLADSEVRNYWITETELLPENFTKSTLIQGRHPTKRLGKGVCIICVSSTYFKAKVLEWLLLLPKALMDREYYENI